MDSGTVGQNVLGIAFVATLVNVIWPKKNNAEAAEQVAALDADADIKRQLREAQTEVISKAL